MLRHSTFVLMMIVFCLPARADRQDVSFEQVIQHYAYTQDETLEVEEQPVQQLFDGVLVYEISYDSPMGGSVPGYLVVPAGQGPFAGVVWGHWMDFQTSSRKEFLDEAIVLAHSGVESVLIDAPFIRPGFVPDADPLSPQYPLAQKQMVLDVRRAIDYLLSRGEVDPERLAYVGHSFSAGIGGILAGVETRFKGVVIMAGRLNDYDYLDSDEPNVVTARERLGRDRIENLVERFYWTNPYHFLREPGDSKILLQVGDRDWFVGPQDGERYMKFIKHPTEMKVYHASHELDTAARLDRGEWLRKLLKLPPLYVGPLSRVNNPD